MNKRLAHKYIRNNSNIIDKYFQTEMMIQFKLAH